MNTSALFNDSLVTFDGGIGTELYERGFYINRPFEELNLQSPNDVIGVHRDYIRAGAQVITTNTFSIARTQLSKFDIDEKQELFIEAALKNAKTACEGSDTKIAFSIGPLGVLIEPLGSFSIEETKNEYAHIARLAKKYGGFHFYILETFSNISELNAAIDGVRQVDRKTPIVASISTKSSQDETIADFVQKIASRDDVEVLGLNCSEGPSDLLTALKEILPKVHKPVIVQPNAGVPRNLNGRYFYMTSPDYMAKYAKRYIEAGAAGVGGCCGTGPTHIKAIRNALRMMDAKVRVDRPRLETAGGTSAEKQKSHAKHESKVLAKILNNEKVISIEILPPKGTDLSDFNKALDSVEQAGIEFVNCPDGARANTRVGSLHIAALIASQKRKLSVIPHFTTRDRNLIALQSDLLGAYVNGVRDVLLITGDPPKLGNNKDATGVYDIDAIGLTYLASCLNHGRSPGGESLGSQTGYGIGVASNPTAINLESEIQRWKYKVESGADFAVTQPIFDPEFYTRWLDKISAFTKPHIVGIWPLISLRNAEFMANEIPGVHVPKWVLEEMAKAGDNREEATKRGVGIARKVMEALDKLSSGFCISAPLGKIEVALRTLK